MGLTAKQFCKLLENADGEIVISLEQPSIGPSSYSSISGLSIGFDWDEGKIFLIPEKKLIDKECLK